MRCARYSPALGSHVAWTRRLDILLETRRASASHGLGSRLQGEQVCRLCRDHICASWDPRPYLPLPVLGRWVGIWSNWSSLDLNYQQKCKFQRYIKTLTYKVKACRYRGEPRAASPGINISASVESHILNRRLFKVDMCRTSHFLCPPPRRRSAEYFMREFNFDPFFEKRLVIS